MNYFYDYGDDISKINRITIPYIDPKATIVPDVKVTSWERKGMDNTKYDEIHIVL